MINMENRETITINIQLNTDKDGNQTSAMSLSKCCRTKVYNTPIIYGNESIYNEIKKHLIYSGQQNKQLLDEIERLKFQLKAADSVNEQLTENQIPEYLIEFVDDVKHMIKLYNNSSHTRSEEYRDKLAEKLDDIRTIDLKP